MFISVYRSSKFALQNFWRNLWLSVITIIILVLTLYTVSLVGMLNLLASQAVQAIEDKIDISINFVPQVAEDDIQAAKVFIEQIPEVKNVRYISQDEALELFKQNQANDADLQSALAELTTNPLPASLIVQANTLAGYAEIMKKFEQSSYNELAENKNFSDHQLVIDKLTNIIQRLYQAGLIVSLVFIVISVVMMFNTIRIAIFVHREELMIMKLVGATNGFIRAPFILEGVLYAVFSSLIATTLVWLTVLGSAPYINAFFTGYNFNLNYFFYNNFIYIIVLQFFCSLLLAVGSSMISIGRYLKV